MKRALSIISMIIFPLACGLGGGGGGGDFLGPAHVAISATPATIDAGERIYVTTYLQEVHQEGILLKFKYPYGLDYISGTALLETNTGTVSISPTHDDREDNYRYLTFFFEQLHFGTDKKGTITFELLGRRRVNKGQEIEVDVDIEDDAINNSDEFDSQRPRFTAEDSAGVKVNNSD